MACREGNKENFHNSKSAIHMKRFAVFSALDDQINSMQLLLKLHCLQDAAIVMVIFVFIYIFVKWNTLVVQTTMKINMSLHCIYCFKR